MSSVLLKIPLSAATGYGHDGFSLSRALTVAGLDVRLLPTDVTPPLPMPVAQLLVKDLNIDFDYLIHHVDPNSLGLTEGEKRLPAKKIAWTMWEYTGFPPEISENLSEKLRGYDLLFVYDEVSAGALQPYADAAGVPLRILQGGYWADEWKVPQAERDWSAPFRFCMVGQLGPRKNPHVAIKAFEDVRKEHPTAELHLKTNVRTLHPAMEEHNPGLKIHYTLWTPAQLQAFYLSSHCYVAPSWGEGKNLPALEAMTSGIPAIYSDIGGHRQWGTSDVGWPVGGVMAEHAPGLGSLRVDQKALTEAMLKAVGDREATRRKGEVAAALIPAMCDWSVVVRKLLETTR